MEDGALVIIKAVLNQAGCLPILARINNAFTAISATVASLTPDQLKAVLPYHVLSGSLPYQLQPFPQRPAQLRQS